MDSVEFPRQGPSARETRPAQRRLEIGNWASCLCSYWSRQYVGRMRGFNNDEEEGDLHSALMQTDNFGNVHSNFCSC